MKNALKLVALGVALAASATMAKADGVSYTISDSNSTTVKTGSASSGVLGNSVTIDGFTITFDAVGAPTSIAPNFSTNAFTIENNSGMISNDVLTIAITDTGLTTPVTPVVNGFTTLSQTSPSFLSDTITNYYDATNLAYGTGTQLASVTYNGDGSFATGPIAATITPGAGPYSETTIYTLTFGPSSNNGKSGPNVNGDSITVSSQITAVPAATPEPSSLALLGTGLLGAAGVARRRFMSR